MNASTNHGLAVAGLASTIQLPGFIGMVLPHMPVFPVMAFNPEGIGKLSTADGKAFADPEVLRRLTSSVSCALDEAAAALTRMRAENTLNAGQADKYVSTPVCKSNQFIGHIHMFSRCYCGCSKMLVFLAPTVR